MQCLDHPSSALVNTTVFDTKNNNLKKYITSNKLCPGNLFSNFLANLLLRSVGTLGAMAYIFVSDIGNITIASPQ